MNDIPRYHRPTDEQGHYRIGDVVMHFGTYYRAIRPNPYEPPTLIWEKIHHEHAARVYMTQRAPDLEEGWDD